MRQRFLPANVRHESCAPDRIRALDDTGVVDLGDGRRLDSHYSPGPRRFRELQRAIDGIFQRMLTLTVRRLERDGLVLRTVYPTVPAQVHY
jgi:hypothetical protein